MLFQSQWQILLHPVYVYVRCVIPHKKGKSRPTNRPIDRLTDWQNLHALSTLNDDSQNWNAHRFCYVELSLDVIWCCCCCYPFTCHRYWRQFYLNFKHGVPHSIIYMHIRFSLFFTEPWTCPLFYFIAVDNLVSCITFSLTTTYSLLSRNQLKTCIIINECGVKIVNGYKKIESKVTKWKHAGKKKTK